jgi:hypothetical protein
MSVWLLDCLSPEQLLLWSLLLLLLWRLVTRKARWVSQGGSKEVVGQVRLMACSKQRRKPNDAHGRNDLSHEYPHPDFPR